MGVSRYFEGLHLRDSTSIAPEIRKGLSLIYGKYSSISLPAFQRLYTIGDQSVESGARLPGLRTGPVAY